MKKTFQIKVVFNAKVYKVFYTPFTVSVSGVSSPVIMIIGNLMLMVFANLLIHKIVYMLLSSRTLNRITAIFALFMDKIEQNIAQIHRPLFQS